MNVIKGDLIQLALQGQFDVIVHGCNCLCRMGRGIAKEIRAVFPEAYEVDQHTQCGERNKLGTYSKVDVRRRQGVITVVNAYTQYSHTGTGVLVDYAAVRSVFKKIKLEFTGLRIGYPKIGAGLARGDWAKIADIINDELQGEDHTLVEFTGKK